LRQLIGAELKRQELISATARFHGQRING